MRVNLTIAALALGTSTAFAQTGPAERPDSSRQLHVERWDRLSDRTWEQGAQDWDWRNRGWNRRGPYRGPAITFGAPGYFVRTLPEVTRVVRYGGLPCRITVTRRVNYRGSIIETERRRCPGRPDVIVQRR